MDFVVFVNRVSNKKFLCFMFFNIFHWCIHVLDLSKKLLVEQNFLKHFILFKACYVGGVMFYHDFTLYLSVSGLSLYHVSLCFIMFYHVLSCFIMFHHVLGLSKRHKEVVWDDVVERQRRSRCGQKNPQNCRIRFRTNFPGKLLVKKEL